MKKKHSFSNFQMPNDEIFWYFKKLDSFPSCFKIVDEELFERKHGEWYKVERNFSAFYHRIFFSIVKDLQFFKLPIDKIVMDKITDDEVQLSSKEIYYILESEDGNYIIRKPFSKFLILVDKKIKGNYDGS